MSEKLFRFLLPELTTIVIRCMAGGTQKKCTGAIEMSAADLKGSNEALTCPVCRAQFTRKVVGGHMEANPLEALGAAIDAVTSQAKRENFQVEFVIPDPNTNTK